uniref:Prefoldin beta subunit n=1 Tax=Tetraselmis sp. GSL018 TaxID=582737 RepID=A0A061R780_9CHLO|mmetsp:Transcript_30265/g.72007  ORF Transcript_30265/g.72007 Transcript_30265/m.72007 type:complete len:129 (+) Transcript_30265:194-580(+)
MAATALYQQHKNEVEAYREIQRDMQKNHSARSQFQTQLSENKMVLQELDILEDDAVVYKMVGPVMVKQDLVEAKSNVGKRLEYIEGEIKRLENCLNSLEKKQNEKQKEIMKIQEKLKDMQQAAGSKQL